MYHPVEELVLLGEKGDVLKGDRSHPRNPISPLSNRRKNSRASLYFTISADLD